MAEIVMSLVFAALLGTFLGSFANVLIIRWHEAAPLTGRSHCPKCKNTIKPRHLVPIISWLLLKGRCAYCSKKIHVQYPLVEAAAMVLSVVAAIRHDPFDPNTAPLFYVELIFTVGLLVPVVMDLRWKELPVEYLVGLGLFMLVFRSASAVGSVGTAVQASWTIGRDLLTMAGTAAFFWLQIFISRGKWLGAGDVWFGAFMGAALGWPFAAVGVYLAYVLGGFAALIGLASGRLKRGDRVPFAPALAAGTLVAYWYGASILKWAAIRYA